MARRGGKLFRWAQRQGEDPGLTHLAPQAGADTISLRLQVARQAWAELWKGGNQWTITRKTRLEAITGEQVQVLLVLHRPPGISELAVDEHTGALLRRQLGVATTGSH